MSESAIGILSRWLMLAPSSAISESTSMTSYSFAIVFTRNLAGGLIFVGKRQLEYLIYGDR